MADLCWVPQPPHLYINSPRFGVFKQHRNDRCSCAIRNCRRHQWRHQKPGSNSSDRHALELVWLYSCNHYIHKPYKISTYPQNLNLKTKFWLTCMFLCTHLKHKKTGNKKIGVRGFYFSCSGVHASLRFWISSSHISAPMKNSGLSVYRHSCYISGTRIEDAYISY